MAESQTPQDDLNEGCPEDADENWLTLVNLPDLVLVRILSYLGFRDLYNAALSCQRMNEIMKHPAAWAKIRMDILASPDLHNEKFNTAKYMAMVEQFGTYFQDLELYYAGYCQPIQEEIKELIEKINEKCQLRNLVLSVHFVETKRFNHGTFNSLQVKGHYDVICSLVATCEHLKSFSLRNWPARRSQPTKNEILEALCANEKNRKLRKLHMFWPDRTERSWVERRTNQTKDYAIDVVQHFTSLTHLSLPSNMMSQKLLNALGMPRPVRLENLRILVVFSRSDEKLQIPHLSWGNVRETCPDMEVEVVFNSRVPEFNMAEMLKANMPISVLYFMKYARVNADEINTMAVNYQSTLKKFISYAETNDADQALQSLVINCQNLHTLIFHSALNFKTVMELAEAKGKKWYQFIVNEETVDLNARQLDPDVVVAYDEEKQEYYQTDVRKWGDSEESLKEKEERFKVMTQSVSESVGWSWKPYSEKKNP